MRRHYKKKINKSMSILLIAGAVATATLGVGYAQWDEKLNIETVISTGKLDVITLDKSQGSYLDQYITITFKNQSDMAVVRDENQDICVKVLIGDREYDLGKDALKFSQQPGQVIGLDETAVLQIDKEKIIMNYIDVMYNDFKQQYPEWENNSMRWLRFINKYSKFQLIGEVEFHQFNLSEGGWNQKIEWNLPVRVYPSLMNIPFVGMYNEEDTLVDTINLLDYEGIVRQRANELGMDAEYVDIMLGLEVPVEEPEVSTPSELLPPVVNVPDEPAVPGGMLPPVVSIPDVPRVPEGILPPVVSAPDEPAVPGETLPPMIAVPNEPATQGGEVSPMVVEPDTVIEPAIEEGSKANTEVINKEEQINTEGVVDLNNRGTNE